MGESQEKNDCLKLDLPDCVTVLHKGNIDIYLVGTAHFSKESQTDVANVYTSFCNARLDNVQDR